MKRLLLGLLLALAVVALGGHYYYERQVEKRVEAAARTVSQMGGHLAYREVAIALNGDIRVDDLEVRIPGLPSTISIERVALHTGGITALHQLAMDARNQRVPPALGFSVDGLRVPLASVTQENGISVTDQFAAAGCGGRDRFSALDLVKMGYSEFVMDNRVDYRLVGGGELLNITLLTATRGMNDVRVELELSLGAPSRLAPAVALAMRNAELLNVRVEAQDQGYARRIIGFCTEQTGLGREAFLAQHLSAWEDVWHRFGLMAGPSTLEAYEQYLNNPDRLLLQARPSARLKASEWAGLSPDMVLNYLSMEVGVNGRAPQPLDIQVMDDAAARDWQAQEQARAEAAGETPDEVPMAPTTEGDKRIPVNELRTYRDARVELTLSNGRTLRGEIRAVEAQRLQLQRFQRGGYVIQPVDYADITEAYLIDD